MTKLRIALGAQLLFFAVWGGYLLSSRNTDSPEFYLETVPVDPRDLISGTFVALSYEIAAPKAANCSSMPDRYYFVKLESRGKTAVTADGLVPVYETVDCSREAREGSGWAMTGAGSRAGAARYGIERFFLNENDARKDARSGSVLAKVKVGKNHQLQLLDLVYILKPRQEAAPAVPVETQQEAQKEIKPGTKTTAKEDLPGATQEVIKDTPKFEPLILPSGE